MNKNTPTAAIDSLMDDFVPAKTVKEKWDISDTTLWRYRRQGLAYYRRGNQIFFLPDDLQEFMKRGRVAAAAA